LSVAVNVAVAVYVPSGTAGLGLFGMVILNWSVEVDPDAGVGAAVSMTCVLTAAFVLEAPRQQLLTTKVVPPDDPQIVVPLPSNTGETSAVFDAFTENPICAYETLVLNPLG
jgi:hypothetical protein